MQQNIEFERCIDFLADKFQGFYDKMEGISIPQPFCAGFVPFALIINKVLDKIPGFEKQMCIRDSLYTY